MKADVGQFGGHSRAGNREIREGRLVHIYPGSIVVAEAPINRVSLPLPVTELYGQGQAFESPAQGLQMTAG